MLHMPPASHSKVAEELEKCSPVLVVVVAAPDKMTMGSWAVAVGLG